MTIEIPLWYSACLCVAGVFFGFWAGRSRSWTVERVPAVQERRSVGRTLLSPAGGVIESYFDGLHPGVRIHTQDSRVLSPVSGRVLRIAPRGNEFLIRADWGEEVLVRACNSQDDLLDRYFRPRVVKGEVIPGGKLLLEYDRDGLTKEGQDTAVYLTALDAEQEQVEMTGRDWVGSGEQVMWIHESMGDSGK